MPKVEGYGHIKAQSGIGKSRYCQRCGKTASKFYKIPFNKHDEIKVCGKCFAVYCLKK